QTDKTGEPSRYFSSAVRDALRSDRRRPNEKRGPRAAFFPQDESSAAASTELAVAVLVLLAGAARAVLVAADLTPARRIARIAPRDSRGGGAAGDAGARQRLAARHGERHLVLAGRRICMVRLHRRQRRR